MKILLVSDVESRYIWDFFERERFSDIDLIISCGDLREKYLEFLTTMIKAPLFYIHGNHDKGYIKNPPGGCENIEDKIVKFKGLRFMGLGGSHRYSNGPFQYTQKQMNRRVKKMKYKLWMNGGVDILIAHSPAYGIGDGTDLCHTGFKAFNFLIEKYKPSYFFHGHQHLNYGVCSRVHELGSTTIVNAFNYHIIEI